MRIFEQSLPAAGCITRVATLHLVAAHAVITLRGKTNVSHHWNVGCRDCANLVGNMNSAFELDDFSASLHKTNSIINGIFD